MFREISQQMYTYIINAEMVFLDIYSVDPWTILRHMSMIDLQVYMKRIEADWKKKNDNFKKKDVIEALKHINLVLTWMFHKK